VYGALKKEIEKMTHFLITAWLDGKKIRELWPDVTENKTMSETKRHELEKNWPDFDYTIRPVSEEEIKENVL
jgi:hypothetical protein